MPARLLSTVLCCTALGWAQSDSENTVRESVLQGNWSEVASSAERLKPPISNWLLGYSNLALGNYKRSLDAFFRVRGSTATQALVDYTDVLAGRNPSSPIAHLLRGDTLARQGVYPAAIASLNRAVLLDPGSPVTYYVRGTVHALAGNVRGAGADFERAVDLDPGLADAHTGLGLVALADGNYSQALQAFAEALRLAPDLPVAHNGLGITQALLGSWDSADAQFGRALELSPELTFIDENRRVIERERAESTFRRDLAVHHPQAQGAVSPTQSYESTEVPISGGRTLDVFVLKFTKGREGTETIQGMEATLLEMVGRLRQRNGLPDSWRPRIHVHCHGWNGEPGANFQFAAAMAEQAGADAVIVMDLRPWFLGWDKVTDWSGNVSEAARQVARAVAAVVTTTGFRPSYSGHSGGAEIIVRLGKLLEDGQLPAAVAEQILFTNVVLFGYPFHDLPRGRDVAVSAVLLRRVAGKIYNFFTAAGNWSNTLAPSGKVANIRVLDMGGRGIPHGAWNDPELRGRSNPAWDIAGAALRGVSPEVVQQLADRLGELGQVPIYPTTQDRPTTEAVAVATLAARGLMLGQKVLVAAPDSRRAKVMLQALMARGLRGAWVTIADSVALQEIARESGCSRILVDRPGPPDSISESLVPGAQRTGAATLPEIRRLTEVIDQFNDAVTLFYEVAGKPLEPQMEVPLEFAAPLIQDLRESQGRQFSVWASHTAERLGRFGLAEIRGIIYELIKQGRLPSSYENLVPLLMGLPDWVAGAASQTGGRRFVPNVEEVTLYLDGLNKICWAVVGGVLAGPKGAKIAASAAGLAASIVRGATESFFRRWAHDQVRRQALEAWHAHVEAAVAHGVPVKRFSDMFSLQDLRHWGFDDGTVDAFDSYADWLNSLSQAKEPQWAISFPLLMAKGGRSILRRDKTARVYFLPPCPPICPCPPFCDFGAGVPRQSEDTSVPPDPQPPGGPPPPPPPEVGGVLMRAEVVKGERGDLSEMFGRPQAGPPGDTPVRVFFSPFLLFSGAFSTGR